MNPPIYQIDGRPADPDDRLRRLGADHARQRAIESEVQIAHAIIGTMIEQFGTEGRVVIKGFSLVNHPDRRIRVIGDSSDDLTIELVREG